MFLLGLDSEGCVCARVCVTSTIWGLMNKSGLCEVECFVFVECFTQKLCYFSTISRAVLGDNGCFALLAFDSLAVFFLYCLQYLLVFAT